MKLLFFRGDGYVEEGTNEESELGKSMAGFVCLLLVKEQSNHGFLRVKVQFLGLIFLLNDANIGRLSD